MALFFVQLKIATSQTVLTGLHIVVHKGFPSSIGAQAWTGGIPQFSHIQGRAFELSSGISATEHGGAIGHYYIQNF